MKLYIYDHCPYCVKARIIFGIKNLDFDLITLLNDDEETPIQLIGQKMVPILVQDGQPPMPESLDIVRYVDSHRDSPIMKPSKENPLLYDWLKNARSYLYFLAMPRWIKMDLEEFKTASAIEYFTKKKEDYIGSFKSHWAKSEDYITMAHNHLSQLEEIIIGDSFFWGDFSEDDLHVFAALRCLTTVKGLKFPPRIDTYMNKMSQSAKIPLHWDKAL